MASERFSSSMRSAVSLASRSGKIGTDVVEDGLLQARLRFAVGDVLDHPAGLRDVVNDPVEMRLLLLLLGLVLKFPH